MPPPTSHHIWMRAYQISLAHGLEAEVALQKGKFPSGNGRHTCVHCQEVSSLFSLYLSPSFSPPTCRSSSPKPLYCSIKRNVGEKRVLIIIPTPLHHHLHILSRDKSVWFAWTIRRSMRSFLVAICVFVQNVLLRLIRLVHFVELYLHKSYVFICHDVVRRMEEKKE